MQIQHHTTPTTRSGKIFFSAGEDKATTITLLLYLQSNPPVRMSFARFSGDISSPYVEEEDIVMENYLNRIRYPCHIFCNPVEIETPNAEGVGFRFVRDQFDDLEKLVSAFDSVAVIDGKPMKEFLNLDFPKCYEGCFQYSKQLNQFVVDKVVIPNDYYAELKYSMSPLGNTWVRALQNEEFNTQVGAYIMGKMLIQYLEDHADKNEVNLFAYLHLEE
jgi:hypothetical protein